MTHRHMPEKALSSILGRYEGSVAKPANVTQIAYYAKVVDIDDPKKSKRIKARIPGIDDNKEAKDIPWCISLIPDFLYWVPQIGEDVVILISNPWNIEIGRLYFGPIKAIDISNTEPFIDTIDGREVAIVGRNMNAVILNYDKNVMISTDILDEKNEHIELNNLEKSISVFADDILLDSKKNVDPQSIVYGERLVELLQWMIRVLKQHKHPPNGSPIPDFFKEADRRSNNMEVHLLNKNVKSK